MFYDDATIGFLIARVGWSQFTPPSIYIVSDDAGESLSFRYFDSFHKMVTAENVYATVNNSSITNADLSNYLFKLKDQNVRSILAILFDNEERANYKYCYGGNRVDISGKDYSSILKSKERLLDNLIGLKMAISCIELFLTTDRLNATERNGKFAYGTLKQELEGSFDSEGKIVTKGLYTKFKIELEKVKNILFPVYQRRTVRGISVW